MVEFHAHKFYELTKFKSTDILVTNYYFLRHFKFIPNNKIIISWHGTNDIYNDAGEQIKIMLDDNPDVKLILINDGSINLVHPRCYTITTKYHAATMLDIDAWNMPVPKKIKNKWFLSLNKRATHDRQYLFTQILKNNLQDYSYLSYLCETDRSISKNLIYGDRKDYERIGFGLEFIDKIPFYNFSQDLLSNDTLIKNYPSILADDCLFQIISETYSEEIYYTEKTLLSLAAGVFPLIIGGKGNMTNLENIGFVLPKDIFDYSYFDDLPKALDFDCKFHKIDKILESLKNFINNYSLEDFSKNWHPYSLHNYHYYRDGFQKNWQKEKQPVLDQVSDLIKTI
jgi:hypothetical protein